MIVGMGSKSCPHPGQRSRRWSSESPLINSGGRRRVRALGDRVARRCGAAAGPPAVPTSALDDVGGRRLGRGRGILPRRGELLLETSNGALEHLQTRLLGVQLRLQAPTVRARLPCLGSHDGLCYTHRREYTTPVNGHATSSRRDGWTITSRTCYEAQMTDEPEDPTRPNNLWEPVPGDHGAHGAFDDRSRRWSWQLWADLHRQWIALAGAGLAGLAVGLCSRRFPSRLPGESLRSLARGN